MTATVQTDVPSPVADILAKWGVPPESMVGKLPRVTCQDCSKRNCQKHQKVKCAGCGAYVSTAHIHLDYMGHAEVTRALIDIDPYWSWEPAAWTDQGEPVINTHDGTAHMWGRLTILGVTRLGVGSCGAGKPELEKELIGDFLRNAAMRFGIGLSLWSKSEWEDAHVDPVTPTIADARPSSAAMDNLATRLAELTPEAVTLYTAWRMANDIPKINAGLTTAQYEAIVEWLATTPTEEPS